MYIKDPIEHKDIYVRTMKNSHIFGEFALLTGQPRSATVKPKGYAIIGQISKEKFEEMMYMHPSLKSSLQKQYFGFQDKFKTWLKSKIK